MICLVINSCGRGSEVLKRALLLETEVPRLILQVGAHDSRVGTAGLCPDSRQWPTKTPKSWITLHKLTKVLDVGRAVILVTLRRGETLRTYQSWLLNQKSTR